MRLSVTRTAKICPIEIAANISACVTGKPAQLHGRPCSPKLQPALPAALFAFAHLALAGRLGRTVGWWVSEEQKRRVEPSVAGSFRGFSKLKFIDRISHRRRVEDVVPGVPGVTAKPVRAKNIIPFLWLQAGHMRPGLAGGFGHKYAVVADHHHFLLVTAEERTLPDIDCRSLRLPIGPFILADEQAGRGAQIISSVKEDGYSGLRIDGRQP